MAGEKFIPMHIGKPRVYPDAYREALVGVPLGFDLRLLTFRKPTGVLIGCCSPVLCYSFCQPAHLSLQQKLPRRPGLKGEGQCCYWRNLRVILQWNLQFKRLIYPLLCAGGKLSLKGLFDFWLWAFDLRL